MVRRPLAALALVALLALPTVAATQHGALRLQAEIFGETAPLRNATRPAETTFALQVRLTALADLDPGTIIGPGIANASGPDDRPIRVTDEQVLSDHQVRFQRGRATVQEPLARNDTVRLAWNGLLEREAAGTTFDLVVQAAGRPEGAENASRARLEVLSRFHVGASKGLPGLGVAGLVGAVGVGLLVVGRR